MQTQMQSITSGPLLFWPHGPGDVFGTLQTRILMCNAHLQRLTGHHSFKVKVCQPRISARFVLPKILQCDKSQQEEWRCTITPVHPRGEIFGGPLRNRRIGAYFANSVNFLNKRFTNSLFSISLLFLSPMALPQSVNPLWLVEVAEPFLLLQNSGENKYCRNSGLADLDLERMMPR